MHGIEIQRLDLTMRDSADAERRVQRVCRQWNVVGVKRTTGDMQVSALMGERLTRGGSCRCKRATCAHDVTASE